MEKSTNSIVTVTAYPTEETTLETEKNDNQIPSIDSVIKSGVFDRIGFNINRSRMLYKDNVSEADASPVMKLEPEHPNTPNYFDWKSTFPQLQILLDNFHDIKEEVLSIQSWTPWPEDHFSDGGGADWTVFPFMHTFPAYDSSKMKWIQSTTTHCPKTTAALKQIPNLRTALFSRLGPDTLVSSHRGWADLANHVLRCHCCLHVPPGDKCGLIVDEEEHIHKEGEIVVFDDSKYHRAYNKTHEERMVLIVDILRPPDVLPGCAKGGHTSELDKFIDLFK
mmetsp:Transcript_38967/g.39661  ORF Transcript_38967/g.39661 Transcript_38967/m.39661 type:complete len:279 (+) Transcript_38967:107-943(+)|eukprot:CAMPEP_0182417544 /NCGR_PEP_ID=MMETSP1167-20130531/1994_1 /TAXON_ID=2988 /ORGANISM="Mallomonas Sp, Strain CCMP3275" /LENGTH=278 /DNA_ID=CAMNT_0024591181 /DNA_START=47 /DNA_END=883 /DNA_ORIENTATION=+